MSAFQTLNKANFLKNVLLFVSEERAIEVNFRAKAKTLKALSSVWQSYCIFPEFNQRPENILNLINLRQNIYFVNGCKHFLYTLYYKFPFHMLSYSIMRETIRIILI